MKKITVIAIICLASFSCKKNRECECKNSNGTYIAGEVESSKRYAKKYCKDLSTTSTDCYLK